jgi:predicted nucleotidyltransferase
MQDLRSAGSTFALVGGLAISVRTEPRFTRDADLAVAVADDLEAEGLIRRLQSQGYAVTATVEQDAVGRLATARLTPPQAAGASVVDLLFASSGIEHEVVAEAESIEVLPDLMIPVAQAGHLIALKLLARDDADRPQDVIDLRALLKGATPGDISLARQAISQITARGFHRGRDLSAALGVLTN